MLIFDTFRSVEHARECATKVQMLYGHKATVCLTEEESQRLDPIPACLNAPTVLVERAHTDKIGEDLYLEGRIEGYITALGGRFVGT